MGILSDATAAAVLPCSDLTETRKFYSEVLGLKPDEEKSGDTSVTFRCGNGTVLMLYLKGMTKGDHTAFAFSVTNFDDTMEHLRAKGVLFEEYDLPDQGIQTVNGVAKLGDDSVAWFKDPSGNILLVGTI